MFDCPKQRKMWKFLSGFWAKMLTTANKAIAEANRIRFMIVGFLIANKDTSFL
jgi:hypothetical protein